VEKGGNILSNTIILDCSKDNIKKYRSPNLLLEGLIAAQNRLNENHPILPILSSNQSSIQAGIGGEERVESELRKHTFTMDHHIFYDLSLFSTCLFQMDALFLTRYYAIIFEAKNIAGTLRFQDNPPQLIQIKDGQTKGYDSPAAQVERYGELLTIWFGSRKIQLPIYRAVVLAYPKQIVERAPAKTKILFPSLLAPYIRSIPQDQIRLDCETFNCLSAELVNNHQFYIPAPICETFHIPRNDIRTGLLCKTCGHLGMKKTIRSWECPQCGWHDHLAHLPALKEWFLILGRKMTNTDCREFLHVDRKTATRILASMDLLSEGTFKNRIYMMDFGGYHQLAKPT
jgi:hypothetical protein